MRWASVLLGAVIAGIGCGRGTPPERVVSAETKAQDVAVRSAEPPTPPPAPPAGAVYAFDPACPKCQRTRGDGCVTKTADGHPVGCGWVGDKAQYAAVVWATKEAKRTLWWFGPGGKTKAFWTPCSGRDPCDADVRFLPDDSLAVVTYGQEPSWQNTLYDLRNGRATPLSVVGKPVLEPAADGATVVVREPGGGEAARAVCVSLAKRSTGPVDPATGQCPPRQ